MQFRRLFLAFVLFPWLAGTSLAQPPAVESALPKAKLRELLNTTGLRGTIHGAIPGRNLYVLTLSLPATDGHGFGSRMDLALTSADTQVLAKLATLTRNTIVRVKGNLIENGAPIPHLDASAVEVLRSFTADPRARRQLPSPEALQEIAAGGGGRLIAMVHFVSRGAPFLVIDYRDHVLPVSIGPLPASSPLRPLLARLNRFDEVAIHYRPMKQVSSHQPLHLTLDLRAPQPIEVLQPISDLHGKPASLKGWLVQYPINPAIGTRHVTYGVRVDQGDGVTRDVFLYSQDDSEYPEMLKLLDAKWNESGWSGVVFSRNRYINQKIAVEVTGTINVEAPNQANPQLLCSKKAIHLSIGSPQSCRIFSGIPRPVDHCKGGTTRELCDAIAGCKWLASDYIGPFPP